MSPGQLQYIPVERTRKTENNKVFTDIPSYLLKQIAAESKAGCRISLDRDSALFGFSRSPPALWNVNGSISARRCAERGAAAGRVGSM